MALNGFAPSTYGSFTAPTQGSHEEQINGSGTNLVVTNNGPSAVIILLGTSAAISASQGNGVMIPPGQLFTFTLGSNTYISAAAIGYGGAQISYAVGS